MTFQNIIVISLIALSTFLTIKHIRKTLGGKGNPCCNDCDNCHYGHSCDKNKSKNDKYAKESN